VPAQDKIGFLNSEGNPRPMYASIHICTLESIGSVSPPKNCAGSDFH
jgi:hypothetical protein